jgi:hypothetical protein
MEVGIDKGLNPSLAERKLSHPLNLVADSNTSPTEDTFIGVPLKNGGKIISGKYDGFPGVDRFFHAVFIDKGLEITFPFFFAPGAGHGMVEQDELKLEPSRFKDFWRLGDNIHPVFGRSETGG